ncbi:hypothetical protein B9Z55_002864 [Caenorhabditis nigoni]|uniref:Uncharacterized protein n=1 Tax=Caenorhabditis nigoni TaxID=1611254 RepID=A0A2G5VMG7_9PELO|nr:hypothetical protein B9Z55_002864 [Caenorhabditis nigoni]
MLFYFHFFVLSILRMKIIFQVPNDLHTTCFFRIFQPKGKINEKQEFANRKRNIKTRVECTRRVSKQLVK